MPAVPDVMVLMGRRWKSPQGGNRGVNRGGYLLATLLHIAYDQ